MKSFRELCEPNDRVFGVTKETYKAKALAFMLRRSRLADPDTADKERDDLGVSISRWDQPSPWTAWQHYFAAKRIPQPFMRVADKYMVPAQWPEQFDAEYFPNAERRT